MKLLLPSYLSLALFVVDVEWEFFFPPLLGSRQPHRKTTQNFTHNIFEIIFLNNDLRESIIMIFEYL